MLAQVGVGETSGKKTEEDHGAEQCQDARVTECECSGVLAVALNVVMDLLERVFADRAVMADSLDAEEASIGGEADFPQGGKILELSADGEVAGVVDGGLGPECAALLVILLDAAVLVVDMERRDDAFREPARTETTRCGPHHATIEDELHLVGSAGVEVVANHLFEEETPRKRTVKDLRQREFGLQGADLVAKAGCTISCRERMRQTTEPLSSECVDLLGIELIGDRLHLLRIGAFGNAVVECREGNVTFCKLALEVLVSIEAELAVAGEVRGELDEERSEVPVDAVEVVLIDHCGGLDEPGVGGTGLRVSAALGTNDSGLLLGLTDEEDSLVSRELIEIFLGDVFLPLAPAEGDEIDAFPLGKRLDVLDESLRDRSHQRRRGKGVTAVMLEKPGDALRTLKDGDVEVAVHAVDTFELEGDVLIEDLGNASCYRHSGLPVRVCP